MKIFSLLITFFTGIMLHADPALAQTEYQGPEFYFAADEQGVQVGVAQPFSTWSDLTALFRPSRWKSPFAVGGSLSWLNFNAWWEDADRTGKVLIGELIVVGAAYAIFDGGGGSSGQQPITGDPETSPSSSGPGQGGGNGGGGDNGGGSADPGAESPF